VISNLLTVLVPNMTVSVDSSAAMTKQSDVHPTLTIYNTLTRKKEPLRTIRPGKVGVYLCGPTVYDKAHIGHMVGPVIFDCIKRYLVYCGYDVNWVVNITDVDDKLINKSIERGISMLDVAEENIKDYLDNLTALGVDQIDEFPRATECMDEIIEFVQSLIDADCAYESNGDVYFDVAQDHDYGKLSNRSVDSVSGDGGDGAARKRNPADFALWKSAKPGEPYWESPWGEGRPGWHIECSAMSRKLLGETFDIHGGGLDLVFPHHENEIAQSECRHEKPFATYWAHNGLLRRDPSAGKIGGRAERDAGAADDAGGKMSRSKGAGGLADLIAAQGGQRIRFFLLRTHYRSTVLFSEPAVDEAGVGMDTFFRFFKRFERVTGGSFYDLTDVPRTREAGEIDVNSDELLADVALLRGKFLAAMDDDFNTGGAIGELFELVRTLNRYCDQHNLESPTSDGDELGSFVRGCRTLAELSGVLGLFLKPPSAGGGDDDLLGQVMQLLIDLRAEARASKNFATADAIRDGVGPLRIVLEDRAGGTEWSGGGDNALEEVIGLLIKLRQTARAEKDFATADAVRDRLAEIGVTLEDRAGGTEWTRA